MTQTERQKELLQVGEAPSSASRLAVLSFASGLVFCCPGTGILAVLAGLASLVLLRIHPEPAPTWRKYAYGGIILGTVTLCALAWLWSLTSTRWNQEWRLLLTGPNNALVALQEGSLEGFRSEFTGPASEQSDASIQAFASSIEDQLGRFHASRSELTEPPDLPEPPPWDLGGYQASFSNLDQGNWTGDIAARIGIERLPSGTLRLTWILLEGEGPDGVPVRIRYPASPDVEKSAE